MLLEKSPPERLGAESSKQVQSQHRSPHAGVLQLHQNAAPQRELELLTHIAAAAAAAAAEAIPGARYPVVRNPGLGRARATRARADLRAAA